MTTSNNVTSIIKSLENLHTTLDRIDDDWEQCPDGGFDLDTINGFLEDYDRAAHDYRGLCQQLLKEINHER